MSNEQIAKLSVERIANRNSVLFLWVTFPYLNEQLKIIERWGFTYKTLGFSWIKTIANIEGTRKWQTKYGFKTKTEARDAGEEAKRQYDNFGKVVQKDEISFSDYLDYWMRNDCEVDLKPITVKNYKKVLLLIKPELGMYRLKSITRKILQSFLIKLYDLGYSYNYLRRFCKNNIVKLNYDIC